MHKRQKSRAIPVGMVPTRRHVAIVARQPEASRPQQRIIRLSDLMTSNYLGWLAFENGRGAKIYFSINPLAFGSKKRTKSAVSAGKGLYLDFDSDGDHTRATLREASTVPPPNAVIHTPSANTKSFGASKDSRFQSWKRR
jgi:hypothetical protein